ncbi:hypothetical protein [Streptomyces sp. NPDC087317]|uniref:hypothetical protein n=1 Tax=Streptomyces sp. NPDC087317 TaxID=3365784 RepID=UPI0037FB03D1
MLGEDLQAHHLLQRCGREDVRPVEGIYEVLSRRGDLFQLDTQGLVELLGVGLALGGLPLSVCCLATPGAAVLSRPSGGLKMTLLAALRTGGLRKCVPHRGSFPFADEFPGDEKGIAARDL